MELHIDLETRSTVDLRKTGTYVYAEHPSTEIIVCCYALGEGPVQTWLPKQQPFMPGLLSDALGDNSVTIVAHNAGFERIVMSGSAGMYLGFPDLMDLSRWDCTAARAAAIGLPRSLGGCGAALGLPIQKDEEGSRLMLAMCKPRKARKGEDPNGIYWFEDEARMTRLAEYCVRDVEVERLIGDTIPKLRPVERETWMMTEEMNDRGVRVDRALLIAVAALIEEAAAGMDHKIWMATDGAVPAVTDHAKLGQWLKSKDVPVFDGVGKAVIAGMLESPDIDPLVREVLIMRRDGGGSSAKKWAAIAKRLSADGRARGALVYCGASSTGRWSSRGIQLQNLPRGGTIPDILQAAEDILNGASIDFIEMVHGPALIVASELLRPAFIAGE